MSLLSGINDFFGLDIGTTAIRVVQVRNRALIRYGAVEIDKKIAQSDSKADQQKMAQIISNLVSQAGILTKNVSVGLPAAKVFTTIVDIDRLDPHELSKSIQYQADALIPTPLTQSKIDWALLGDSPADKNKVELLLSSVTNDFVEQRLDLLESIGLNVIAFEPDTLALSRSIVPVDMLQPVMVLDVGSASTDLVITMNGAPRLVRAIPTGSEAFVRAAVQNLNIDEQQAQQFVFKFGLSKDKLEGQIYNAVIGTVDLLVSEVEKSIKFFMTRYGEGAKLDRIFVTGGASVLPEFPLYLANKFAVNVEIGNAWRNVSYPLDRQNELLAASNHFAVASGLAERVE